MIWTVLTNRLFLSGAAVLFFIGCISLGWQNGLSRRAAVAAEAQVAVLDTQLVEKQEALTVCETNLFNARTSIQNQNEAIDQVIRSAAEARARSEACIKAAEAQTRAAQRRAETIRTFQPQDGETQCEAAFRLHQETSR